MTTVTNVKPPISVRPLVLRPQHALPNWHAFLKTWERENITQSEMLGMLHEGFGMDLEAGPDAPAYEPTDRLYFYLTIADGHLGFDDTSMEDIRGRYRFHGKTGLEYLSSKDIRTNIAQKAFSELSRNFFKPLGDEPRDNSRLGINGFMQEWVLLVASPRLFPVLQRFFRIEVRHDVIAVRNIRIRPYHQNPEERAAAEFLEGLAKLVWGWPHTGEYPDLEKRLDDAKPWMVEVLHFLGKLSYLEKWLPLDDQVVSKLKEIALRTRARVRDGAASRKVVSLDEARFAKSAAAWLLEANAVHKRVSAEL